MFYTLRHFVYYTFKKTLSLTVIIWYNVPKWFEDHKTFSQKSQAILKLLFLHGLNINQTSLYKQYKEQSLCLFNNMDLGEGG